jgi:hypothetical protein
MRTMELAPAGIRTILLVGDLSYRFGFERRRRTATDAGRGSEAAADRAAGTERAQRDAGFCARRRATIRRSMPSTDPRWAERAWRMVSAAKLGETDEALLKQQPKR